DADAQLSLGLRYLGGEGVARDEAEAAKWFRKSAEQGSAYGQYALGGMYANGNGVSRDYAEALKWYRKSAEQGNPDGQNSLGGMYLAGLGVGKNPAEAVKWFRKSAEQGDSDGQLLLGTMYKAGLGVGRNFTKAVKWFRKSADQGNPDGQHALGVMYEGGLGVSRNYQEALKWYRKAAAQGNKDAQSGIERLEKQNTSRTGGNVARKSQGSAAADDDPGAVSIFGRKVYLRGEFDDCPWDKLYDRCLIRKVGDRVYMATAYMRADWAPYKFKFGDASWITNFGYAPESKPGIYDYARGTPIKMNPKAVFEEIKVTPPHDGKYDFYLDFSGEVPVTYIREHR
ncbi:MAG: SEL1-like repeat protein, partial [Succinivibrionaceae bacterium]|nr:SEL1-like repeat protein [Succinivibrionaceae bacterium]